MRIPSLIPILLLLALALARVVHCCVNIASVQAEVTLAATPTPALPQAYASANDAIGLLDLETVNYNLVTQELDSAIETLSVEIQARIDDSMPWNDLEVLLQAQIYNKTLTDTAWGVRQSQLQSDIDRARYYVSQAQAGITNTNTLIANLRREMQRRSSARLSTGVEHTCMITTNDTIACWGRGDLGQTTPPPGTYKEVSVGDFLTCAIDSNDLIVCFGSKVYGRTLAPAGKFKQISVGGGHSCAIELDTLAAQCWGWNEYAQCDVPAGMQWISISAGFTHTCGVDISGSVSCWGSNGNDRANPGQATQGRLFASVSAGVTHS